MKISRRGWIPQLEPDGRLGVWLTRLGGAKMLVQRSGVVANKITMVSALTAAWATNPSIQDVFLGSFALYIGSAFLAIAVYGLVDHACILPGEQGYTQEQAHQASRSPLKRDTERILDQLDSQQAARTDGGSTTVVPECGDCATAGVNGQHKGESVVECPDCHNILYTTL